jgi:hypothetical protein
MAFARKKIRGVFRKLLKPVYSFTVMNTTAEGIQRWVKNRFRTDLFIGLLGNLCREIRGPSLCA